MRTCDVLVVGAGPTGLTLASECARYGLSCILIDQAEKPIPYSRAIAIQARTLETFQKMGVHQAFLDSGLPVKASNIYAKGKRLGRIDLGHHIPSPFPFVLSLEQSRTEKILTEHLHHLGVEVERPTRFLSYQETDGKIRAKTDQGEILAEYLVGCDGAHSSIRKSLKGSFKGKTFSDVFSLADVKIDWGRRSDELHVFWGKSSIMAALPLPEEGRFRLIFQLERLRGLLRPEHVKEQGLVDPEKIAPPQLDEIQEVLSALSQEQVKLHDPRWIANFHINSRLSSTYRKNTIFLAGDAGHIHSPVGGQGMNTGIQDAFNLGWKIAYVKHRWSSSTLLCSYEMERHQLGTKLLKGTERASRLVTLHSPIVIALRNLVLPLLLRLEAVQKKIAAAISQISILCPKQRVPNYTLLIDNQEVPYYRQSEKSTTFDLLLFNVPTPPLVHPRVTPYHVKTDGKPKAILVRPDGYLALEDHLPFNKLCSYSI